MNKLITTMLAIFWVNLSVASEPSETGDQLHISPPLPVGKLKVVKVRAPSREVCEGWVQLGYHGPSDIINGNIEILDSMPPGKYDDEAMNELIAVKNMETPPFAVGMRKEVIGVDEDGQKMNVYTFSVGCNEEVVVDKKPNKTLNPDASDAGAG